MIQANRAILWAVFAVLAMIAGMVASLSYLEDCSDDANRASADVVATRAVVKEIRAMRPAGSVEDPKIELASSLPALIDSAMKAAEIDAQDLVRITPQAARHIGQTSESEVPIQLVFHKTSLHQVLNFIQSLIQGENWIYIREVHLTHPAEIASEGPTAQWDVEITISYLTNSPSAAGISADSAN